MSNQPAFSGANDKCCRSLAKWKCSARIFNDRELRMSLFNLYIFTEIGGAGGGCFRYMYSRFLEEAAKITKNEALKDASAMFNESVKLSEIGLMFKDAETTSKIGEKIEVASRKFDETADIEEKACLYLKEHALED
ncbi:MAG TPA: DUF4872 domain-containing protein [candidate division Zixibacteria bacterium]|nr:DUF4872 domain-containing protein [candidate division Zixibacteria bacterium]